jgi:hypothetical protein
LGRVREGSKEVEITWVRWTPSARWSPSDKNLKLITKKNDYISQIGNE